MILDTSALMAVILREREAEIFADVLGQAASVKLSAAGYLEASIVLEKSNDEVLRQVLDDFLLEFEIRVEPVTLEQARAARYAFRAFGKGRHPAGLNFGDCFTYGLAKVLREPVLFKGDDFRRTDLIPAWDPERPA